MFASFGLKNQPRKNGVDTEAVTKEKGDGKKQTSVRKDTALTPEHGDRWRTGRGETVSGG